MNEVDAFKKAMLAWHHADTWCRALEKAFNIVLEQHKSVGHSLNVALEPMKRGEGEQPNESVEGLWAEEARLRAEMEGLMACRRAAAKRRTYCTPR